MHTLRKDIVKKVGPDIYSFVSDAASYHGHTSILLGRSPTPRHESRPGQPRAADLDAVNID